MDVTCNRLGKAEAMKFKKHMKHRDHSEAASCDPDKNERFVLRKCAIYLDRLLDAYPLSDRDTIKLLAWVMGPKMISIG